MRGDKRSLMEHPLQNLKMKWWHAVLIVASFSTFELALFVRTVVFDNFTVVLIALGFFFIGLGEFANQSFQEGIAFDKNGKRIGTIRRDARVPVLPGYILDFIGLALILIGLIHVILPLFANISDT